MIEAADATWLQVATATASILFRWRGFMDIIKISSCLTVRVYSLELHFTLNPCKTKRQNIKLQYPIGWRRCCGAAIASLINNNIPQHKLDIFKKTYLSRNCLVMSLNLDKR